MRYTFAPILVGVTSPVSEILLFFIFPLKNNIYTCMHKRIYYFNSTTVFCRGLIPIIILQHLEKASGIKVHEMFDYVAGTSTGTLIMSEGEGGREGGVEQVFISPAVQHLYFWSKYPLKKPRNSIGS